MSQFVSYNRLAGKRFSENFTLVAPLQALLNNTALTPGAGATHYPTFVIEVAIGQKSEKRLAMRV